MRPTFISAIFVFIGFNNISNALLFSGLSGSNPIVYFQPFLSNTDSNSFTLSSVCTPPLDRFHNDESGWKVFATVEGKIGNRWWLWVSRSVSVVYFQIAPGRGANVPVEYFKNIQKQKIIVICDRYSAYKSLAKQLPFIILAFCWAHVRRDYLDAARKYPDLEEWALCWVEKIGELYHINNLRCKTFDQKLPMQWQPDSFKKQHKKLTEKMDEIIKERDAFIELHNPDDPDSDLLSNVKYKIFMAQEVCGVLNWQQ